MVSNMALPGLFHLSSVGDMPDRSMSRVQISAPTYQEDYQPEYLPRCYMLQ